MNYWKTSIGSLIPCNPRALASAMLEVPTLDNGTPKCSKRAYNMIIASAGPGPTHVFPPSTRHNPYEFTMEAFTTGTGMLAAMLWPCGPSKLQLQDPESEILPSRPGGLNQKLAPASNRTLTQGHPTVDSFRKTLEGLFQKHLAGRGTGPQTRMERLRALICVAALRGVGLHGRMWPPNLRKLQERSRGAGSSRTRSAATHGPLRYLAKLMRSRPVEVSAPLLHPTMLAKGPRNC